jgi:glycosyltransferase involved in cell wall biosynthesis
MEWHLITCEYPPQFGGVSDYTRQVAEGLAQDGDHVHVWCPSHSQTPRIEAGVAIHPELGEFSLSNLRKVGHRLNDFSAPRRLFVQWVPHGYGYRSINLGFCLWLLSRARLAGDIVHLMVHEPFLSFRKNAWRQNGAAVIHRVMMMALMQAATRISISTPAWEHRVKKYALGRRIPTDWLSLPSNVPLSNPSESIAIRKQHAQTGDTLIGHFGTFGSYIRQSVAALILRFRDDPDMKFLLIGPGGKELLREIAVSDPFVRSRVSATGGLTVSEVSPYIGACDFMVQPYEDGVTTRRTTVMAALCQGKAVVTEDGPHTEDLWRSAGGVMLSRSGDFENFSSLVERLTKNPSIRDQAGLAAAALYSERFDIRNVIAALRDDASTPSVPNLIQSPELLETTQKRSDDAE